MESQPDIIYPDTPRSALELLQDSLRLLARDPLALIGVPVVFSLPRLATDFVDSSVGTRSGSVPNVDLALLLLLSVGSIVGFFGQLLGEVFLLRRAAHLRGGERVPVSDEILASLRRVWPFLLVTLVVFPVVSLGFLFFVIPGFVLLYLMGFAPTYTAIRGTGFVESFRRAREVVRGEAGHWLAGIAVLFGLLFVTALVVAPLNLANMAEAVATGMPFRFGLVTTVVFILINCLASVYWALFLLDLEARQVPLFPAPGTDPGLAPAGAETPAGD